ncbi:hypothetical protein ORN63_000891 [Vibrio parahaemolyticus]|nr:hypothetical protein [Vibrio parahaemolyticus]EHH1248576.1 hypothetical protein [Vibrio parahaemolyticus]EHW0631850.1 hypothetical protein [Vibrio parahaemolyticus]EJA3304309.1 hypothetical protein [Vibrio parahaemolyticus]EJG0012260.1 hypothetical protein [Vibrio parahaemolyticus]
MTYTITEHKHRFSAWAASRASSVKETRFTVKQGKQLIESIGLDTLVDNPDKLPARVDIDKQHRLWREQLIAEASKIGLTFTHGVAAKLINMYLKSALVCGGYDSHVKVVDLHPPIDAVLLNALCRSNIGGLKFRWKEAELARWSKFSSDQYEQVIQSIREVMGSRALWEIEEFWKGHQ